MSYRSIEAYTDDLAWRLRIGMRGRRRIVSEVTAHLADLVAEEEAAGLTPQAAARRATTRFGAPGELAAEFNRDCALHSARIAAWALVACVAAAVGAAGLANRGGAPAVPWPDQAAYFAVPVLLGQVAAMCAGTAFLLVVFAPWLLGRTPRSLATAVRAQAVAVLALAPIAVISAGNIAHSAWDVGAMSALVALAVPVALVFSVRSALRVGTASGGTSTLDVIADCCEALAMRWTWSTRLYELVTGVWSAAVERMPRLMSWLEMRRHPWRSAVTLSVAAGIALKAPDLLKGDLDVPAAAIEAVAAFLGYCLFSGLLGLRTRNRRGAVRVEGLEAVQA
ncbi:permease prefix domain 1-containing protein [Catenulispora rubra]|uniref:permease prefix domain 1-containing protein n=1 Tax=Catenulispora rubra TaxID=280293 RepID=UPI0018925B84|nr:permease prefix domain 1-containing protein [Catenulispora rubra]